MAAGLDVIGDDLAAALPELRAQAESLMVDAGTLVRGGTATWDDAAGKYTTGGGTTVYSGKCRVQTRDVQPGSPAAGDAVFTTLAHVIQVPMSVVGVEVGDTFTLTSSVFDADLVGRVFRVVGLVHKTHMTARRLVCEEVQ